MNLRILERVVELVLQTVIEELHWSGVPALQVSHGEVLRRRDQKRFFELGVTLYSRFGLDISRDLACLVCNGGELLGQ